MVKQYIIIIRLSPYCKIFRKKAALDRTAFKRCFFAATLVLVVYTPNMKYLGFIQTVEVAYWLVKGHERRIVDRCFFAGCDDFLIGCIQLADTDIVGDRILEKLRFLCHAALHVTQTEIS